MQQLQAAEEAAGYAAESRPRCVHDEKEGVVCSANSADPDARAGVVPLCVNPEKGYNSARCWKTQTETFNVKFMEWKE